MRVAMVGLGYVGLVTSACLAEQGNDVIGVEVGPERIRTLLEGRMPFHEPGLTELVAENRRRGRLEFTSDPSAVVGADIVFIAVGTHDGNGGWQTSTIQSCLAQVVPLLDDEAVLVVRSTLPPLFLGHLPGIVGRIREESGRPGVPVLLNPEFTKEGTAVQDFMEPDRVVLGVASDPTGHGLATLQRLYRDVTAPVMTMTATDAAMSKLGANLFLATKISFANELAQLCDAYGATVDQVVAAMAYDHRIGGGFLRPGIGFGGSCLPHQVTMTIAGAAESGFETPLFAAVQEVNHRQRRQMVERLAELLGGSILGTRIALLGVTFKPETDDLREAPALDIATRLVELGATVVAFDPMTNALERFAELVPGVRIADSIDDALDGADAVALATEWNVFRRIDWHRAASLMRRAIVVDGRNALPAADLVAAGFTYSSFGRGAVAAEQSTVEAASAAGVEEPVSAPDAVAAQDATERHGASRGGVSLDLARMD